MIIYCLQWGVSFAEVQVGLNIWAHSFYTVQDVHNDRFESFEALHERAHRVTPLNYSLYKHAQILHKLYNGGEPDIEWVSLNFQHQFSMRQGHIIVAKANNLRVGENIIINRLSVLNRKIPLEWMNFSYGGFKKRIKELFL